MSKMIPNFEPVDRVPLGPEGLAYVRRRLEMGKTLARSVAAANPQLGGIFTLLPSGAKIADLADFDSGGKLPGIEDRSRAIRPIPNTDAALAALIQEYLSGERGRVCVFENFNAEPDDPYLARMRGLLFHDNEVYHFITAARAAQAGGVASIIAEAKSIPQFVGILTSQPDGMAMDSEHNTVGADLLQQLAIRTRAVIVGAYDGESYVIAETALKAP